MTTKALILTAIATTLSIASFAPTAKAEPDAINGRSLNGLTTNGIHMNGLARQGIHMNGLARQGIHMNGLSANGLAKQDTQLNGKTAQGRQLNGVAPQGAQLNEKTGQGLQLNGLHMKDQPSQATVSQDALQTGLTLSSPSFSSIRVEGGYLVGVK